MTAQHEHEHEPSDAPSSDRRALPEWLIPAGLALIVEGVVGGLYRLVAPARRSEAGRRPVMIALRVAAAVGIVALVAAVAVGGGGHDRPGSEGAAMGAATVTVP